DPSAVRDRYFSVGLAIQRSVAQSDDGPLSPPSYDGSPATIWSWAVSDPEGTALKVQLCGAKPRKGEGILRMSCTISRCSPAGASSGKLSRIASAALP